MKVVVMAAAAVLLAAPAVAQEGTQLDPKPIKVKKVCRTLEVTGRRIAQSVCRTPAQWEEADRIAEENAKRLMDTAMRNGATQGRSAATGPNGGTASNGIMGLNP